MPAQKDKSETSIQILGQTVRFPSDKWTALVVSLAVIVALVISIYLIFVVADARNISSFGEMLHSKPIPTTSEDSVPVSEDMMSDDEMYMNDKLQMLPSD